MYGLGRLPEALSGLDAAPDDAEAASESLCRAMREGFLAVFPEGETVVGEAEVKVGKDWAAVH